jgi:hypothetical protein
MTVPLAMKLIGLKIDTLHFLIGDLVPDGIFPAVQSACHLQPLGRGCLRNEIDDRFVVAQRLTAPIRRDKGKEPVFDLVPFAGAWRKV